jgi:hypothetical protein
LLRYVVHTQLASSNIPFPLESTFFIEARFSLITKYVKQRSTAQIQVKSSRYFNIVKVKRDDIQCL